MLYSTDGSAKKVLSCLCRAGSVLAKPVRTGEIAVWENLPNDVIVQGMLGEVKRTGHGRYENQVNGLVGSQVYRGCVIQL